MAKRERGIICCDCTETRWFDPRQGDPGCPCGGGAAKRANVTGAYNTPITLYSVGGVESHEQTAFRLACPGTDLSPDGVPIARNRQEKLRILKHFGWEERN